jgi:methylase of polypeptide subunit release factors
MIFFIFVKYGYSGSGCISLALAHILKSNGLTVSTLGIDRNPRAVSLARLNARLSGLEKESSFLLADVFEPGVVERHKGTGFDMVVSNPPYILRGEWERLDKEVKEWEDPIALIGEDVSDGGRGGRSRDAMINNKNDDEDEDVVKGTVFYKRIVELAKTVLKIEEDKTERPPSLVFEIGGSEQVDIVEHHLIRNGFGNVVVQKDLRGFPRVLLGTKKN